MEMVEESSSVTDRYAVIGNPISHTKSPQIHRAFAAATGQDIEYIALEAPVGGFAAMVDELRQAGTLGLNVTLPFKVDAFAYAGVVQQRARLAGAVNALKFVDGSVIGDNFDGLGLVRDIAGNLRHALRDRRVLLLGTGGATRGALLPFLEEGPARLAVAGRKHAAVAALAREVAPDGGIAALDYGMLAGQGPFDVVVNATSASLRDELPPIGHDCFAPGCLAYELAYGKGLTPFLRLARDAGAGRVADGVGMLVEQAAEAFAWWRGIRPATEPVIRQLTVPLI